VAKPVILAVDDDAQVLAAVQRDLTRHYAATYRIVGAGGGGEGLEVVAELKKRGGDIALFLVDQRMPEISGTEFLERAGPSFPDAKRVLLTAYADTEVAIQGINQVGLDHYLVKPWDPPEDRLYPVLDDLLDDWAADRPAPFDGIRVLGPRWSALTYDVKDFLSLNQVPYRFVDVERTEGKALLAVIGPDAELPVIAFPEGDHLARPDRRALGSRIGLQTALKDSYYDLVIIGAGPAGLAGAVYGASEGLHTAVIEREATGGQAGTSSRIENYLGFPNGISGADLARRATAQAHRLGAEIISPVEVNAIRIEEPMRVLELSDGTEVRGRSLLIASGMTVRKLDVPGYDDFTGAGVFYGASVSEAANYKGEEVFVIGGANSAGQAAMMFSRFAGKVTIVVRAASIGERMSAYLVDQVQAKENIEVLTNTVVEGVSGGEHVEKISLRNAESGETEERKASGVFVFVGAVPHTDFCRSLVECNPQGFIVTGTDLVVDGRHPKGWPVDRDPFLLESSVPGIFAAGDVRHGAVRRVASAVGQGSICVSFVHRYLETV
jgi:thioredoxin reductase (NADPH)